jgi:hypothetical protein
LVPLAADNQRQPVFANHPLAIDLANLGHQLA